MYRDQLLSIRKLHDHVGLFWKCLDKRKRGIGCLAVRMIALWMALGSQQVCLQCHFEREDTARDNTDFYHHFPHFIWIFGMVKTQLLQAWVCTLFAGPELPWAQIALHAEVVRTDKTPKQMQRYARCWNGINVYQGQLRKKVYSHVQQDYELGSWCAKSFTSQMLWPWNYVSYSYCNGPTAFKPWKRNSC